MLAAVAEAAPALGVTLACRALGVPRASYYRSLSPPVVACTSQEIL